MSPTATPAPGASAARRKAAEATAPPSAPAARDPFFDNAKYLALVLVALGHAWQPLTYTSRVMTALYMTVYAFHMPAFILVSGYFSRGFDLSPAKVRRLVSGVVVPYLVFEVAYTWFQHWAEKGEPPEPLTLLNPWYLNWFLAALFVWRLTTPVWQALRWPVPLSLVLATLAMTCPSIGDDFDLMRVFQFLPFFVAGLNLERHHFELVRRRWVRIAAVPVLAGAVALAYGLAPHLDEAWLFRNYSVQALHQPLWTAPVATAALTGCAAVLIVCFLAWVPRRRTWFTALGGGTLYGFLLHGFLIKLSRWWDWYEAAAWIKEPVGWAVVTLLAVAMITVLCSPPVRRVFRPVVEPRADWLFRR
ncbi:membrane protein [Streptomyces mashuensis]|uniref:Membrane protein n=1 Tax=Streptomyces mashuensis TaxID=33904 RepID=A0A919B213_9ACTN|nr:acyltransferase family protein [Streptomyces mashuensis]GHF35714.1 membrane protein [Streptomyces mashuensis]